LFTFILFNGILFFDKYFMDIQAVLRQLGLTPSEIAVYLFLLSNGLTTPPIVSRETKIARTNCYHIFESLGEKGLTEEMPDGKRKAYRARNPESVIRMLERQQALAHQIIPDLQALYTPQKFKPQISFCEGWEAVRALFYKALDAPIITLFGELGPLQAATGELYTFFTDQIKQRGITYTHIGLPIVSRETIGGPIAEESAEKDEKALSATIILQWNDTIALITALEPAFATVITQKEVGRTFQILFRMLKSI
jgi:predicted transcriptional regulator